VLPSGWINRTKDAAAASDLPHTECMAPFQFDFMSETGPPSYYHKSCVEEQALKIREIHAQCAKITKQVCMLSLYTMLQRPALFATVHGKALNEHLARSPTLASMCKLCRQCDNMCLCWLCRLCDSTLLTETRACRQSARKRVTLKCSANWQHTPTQGRARCLQAH
jgi:hypothetical protein